MLTETGAEVARRAERVLAAARDLADFARHRGRLLTGQLRLGVIPSLAPYVLPKILPALQRAHPDLRIELRETQTRILIEELIARRARRGACWRCRSRRATSRRCALFDDPFLLAVPAADAAPKPRRASMRATSISSG